MYFVGNLLSTLEPQLTNKQRFCERRFRTGTITNSRILERMEAALTEDVSSGIP